MSETLVIGFKTTLGLDVVVRITQPQFFTCGVIPQPQPQYILEDKYLRGVCTVCEWKKNNQIINNNDHSGRDTAENSRISNHYLTIFGSWTCTTYRV